ncbi:MAG: hypothetical protein EHM14_01355 [Methanothrix sp.]|nr:MAG: hypothetical protein EHM14_01355 [Methanothrix sp.]
MEKVFSKRKSDLMHGSLRNGCRQSQSEPTLKDRSSGHANPACFCGWPSPAINGGQTANMSDLQRQLFVDRIQKTEGNRLVQSYAHQIMWNSENPVDGFQSRSSGVELKSRNSFENLRLMQLYDNSRNSLGITSSGNDILQRKIDPELIMQLKNFLSKRAGSGDEDEKEESKVRPGHRMPRGKIATRNKAMQTDDLGQLILGARKNARRVIKESSQGPRERKPKLPELGKKFYNFSGEELKDLSSDYGVPSTKIKQMVPKNRFRMPKKPQSIFSNYGYNAHIKSRKNFFPPIKSPTLHQNLPEKSRNRNLSLGARSMHPKERKDQSYDSGSSESFITGPNALNVSMQSPSLTIKQIPFEKTGQHFFDLIETMRECIISSYEYNRMELEKEALLARLDQLRLIYEYAGEIAEHNSIPELHNLILEFRCKVEKEMSRLKIEILRGLPTNSRHITIPTPKPLPDYEESGEYGS